MNAARGVLLTLGGRGVTLLAQFGALLVLSRHLDKAEFGLAWMAAVVVGVFGAAADLGMDVVNVQRRGVDDRRAAQLSESAGFALCLLVLLLGPLLSRAFGDPAGLAKLIQTGGIALLFAGFAAPAHARLRRDLQFGRLACVDAARALAVAGLSIAFAVSGYGAWSLVLGDVFGSGLSAALAWLLAPAMRDGPEKNLFADGVRIVGTRLADTCFVQADRFFVGTRLGAGALGLYGFAWRHAMLVVQHGLPVAQQVALPIFSRLQRDRPALVEAYLALTRVLALVVVPFSALLWGLAPWLVDLLYPDRWTEAVPALRALCVAAAATGLNSEPGLLWMAVGRMRLRLVWSLANLAVIVPVVWIGTRYGIEGVAYALAARSLVATVVAQAITRRVAGVPHAKYLRALLPGGLFGGLFYGLFLL